MKVLIKMIAKETSDTPISKIMTEPDSPPVQSSPEDPPPAPKYVPKPKPKGWGQRHFTTMMLFLGMAFAYVMRTNMSVAIVAMTNPEKINDMEAHQYGSPNNDPRKWSSIDKGIILSSFFYGYVLTQLPVGLLTNKFNAQRMLCMGMLVNSVFAFLVPLSAQSYWWLVVIRFIQGMGEGPIVPCTHAILAKWIPPGERSFLGGIVYSGAQFGTIISYPASGYLAHGKFLDGWPAIFYIFGFSSYLWCVAFLFFVYENPHDDPRCSQEEQDYVLYSIFGGDVIEDLKDIKTPWREIFHSLPFISILVAHMGQNFGYETLMTMLPTFLSEIFHFDLKSNGLISSTPYIAMFLTSCTLNFLADYLIRRRILSTRATRKLMNSIGEFGPGVMFILVILLNFPENVTLLCIIIALACNGAIYAGFKVNHIDISPCYAGILMSMTNCSANVVGMFAPTVSGCLLHWFENDKMFAWKVVFLVSAALYITCATVFLLFASGKKQPWDKKTTKNILKSRRPPQTREQEIHTREQ